MLECDAFQMHRRVEHPGAGCSGGGVDEVVAVVVVGRVKLRVRVLCRVCREA